MTPNGILSHICACVSSEYNYFRSNQLRRHEILYGQISAIMWTLQSFQVRSAGARDSLKKNHTHENIYEYYIAVTYTVWARHHSRTFMTFRTAAWTLRRLNTMSNFDVYLLTAEVASVYFSLADRTITVIARYSSLVIRTTHGERTSDWHGNNMASAHLVTRSRYDNMITRSAG